MQDVIVVGAGPAGLNAALVLARCRRSVLVIDHGKPRNAASHAMHNYLSRDGVNPHELLKLGRAECRGYGVKFIHAEVLDAVRRPAGHFEVKLHDRQRFRSRKLLLATGVRDQLPRIEGLAELYGTSVHHCPYCDGWEWRGKRLAAYGKGKEAVGLALVLKTWSDDILVCLDGQGGLRPSHRDAIKREGFDLCEQKISRLAAANGRLHRVEFEDGTSARRDALFFNTGQQQKSTLAERLGCEFDGRGGVKVDRRERTGVPGLYLAGDASRDVQFVICAASQGAVAAVAINRDFQDEAGHVL